MSYEGFDYEVVRMILAHDENNNNDYNVVSDSESEDEEGENFLWIKLNMTLK